jgi:hypothetical protein
MADTAKNRETAASVGLTGPVEQAEKAVGGYRLTGNAL